MKKAFVVDFDGTITVQDVGFSIIKELANEGWKEVGDLWVDKKIGTEKCGKMQWDLIKYDDNYIKDFVKKFDINKGFIEFIEEMKKNSYEMVIASDGYDVYISEILKRYGLENLKVICNSAKYNEGWKLSFLNSSKECAFCGNCKRDIVDDFKSKGYKVYYIGDGHSDICASKNADVIFAKSFLKEYCEKEKISYYNFNNFFDIMKYI
ncbi:MtnX-like HAD-IB family phosphatase [Clostridium sp. P21]|uniref:MtnX-like HAD-IB family phosphatase n=1 Tax=Clostridium muellerianum TaxID=2716538 RepID=A0A7Y0HNU7_9CLOT|nr:MtnX-like HAD-IB family phosphatase [Clostridium muellerianum]NMM62386.1 MtnX-like HAD-IB family phosphatase [Clostridium muellerianum]